MVAKVVEMPFDTIKVRLQAQPVRSLNGSIPAGETIYKGSMDCFYRTIQSEGVGALYRVRTT